MVGFSEEAMVKRRRNSAGLRAVDVVQFTRRQVLAAVEHWASSGKSVEQLKFRLRTMRIHAPSGDTRRDDALILSVENGGNADYEIVRVSEVRASEETEP